jgi:hypothetical protein
VEPGATISSASIQFTSCDSLYEAINLMIEGEKSANSPYFTEADDNLSSRPKTGHIVTWAPPAWDEDEAGDAEKTPDLSAIIQEIIDLPDWASGNHMTFFYQ